MKTFVFDVMLDGRFVCTLKYKYCALFPIDFEELKKFVLKKRLRNILGMVIFTTKSFAIHRIF